ncbi:MAG TPA: hypothetical protein VG893_08910 [Terracidiphilus sp.]|nr:hypothetical protein [Terracidiphilus sp.]
MPKPPSQPECFWTEECIEECNGPSLFVEEQGVRATFVNPRGRRLRKVHYDGCYAPNDARQADYILGLSGVIDVIVELKKSDTNIKGAAQQVEGTLVAWKQDSKRAPSIAALIVYGRIEGKKKLPGRLPRATAMISGVVARFLRQGTLLLIEETGTRQYSFSDFTR